MAQISENTIELIRTTADIVDVISSYMELKKKGRNFLVSVHFMEKKHPLFLLIRKNKSINVLDVVLVEV